jgi:formate dehydrogenase subunit gamma
VIHAVLAGLWLSVSFGHIYLGLFGVPGSLRGMVKGDVSAEWAKEHHNVWYEQLKGGSVEKPTGRQPASPSQPGSEPLR